MVQYVHKLLNTNTTGRHGTMYVYVLITMYLQVKDNFANHDVHFLWRKSPGSYSSSLSGCSSSMQGQLAMSTQNFSGPRYWPSGHMQPPITMLSVHSSSGMERSRQWVLHTRAFSVNSCPPREHCRAAPETQVGVSCTCLLNLLTWSYWQPGEGPVRRPSGLV